MGKSIMEQIAMLPEDERAALLADFDEEQLLWDWSVWGRPEQIAPAGDDWNIWLVMAGRGFGKTRLAAEWVREQAKYTKDGQRRFALVARTAADVRDVIVEGESGIINVSPPSEKPHYEPSKRRLTWPNGNTASLFTADEPDGLRGPQFTHAWEPPSWYPSWS
jgi:phage terminase large subunit-like protein